MEKSETKRTKRKTLQITYPAPYSQSWNPDILPVLMKHSMGRSTRPIPKRKPLSEQQIKSNHNTSHKKNSMQAAQKKPERKKICVHLMHCTLPPGAAALSEAGGPRNPLTSTLTGRRPLPRSRTSSVVVGGGQKYSLKMRNAPASTGNSQFPPIFVIRSVDKHAKQLSKSKTTHMDIKPKRIASLSPSFCPSPNFRALSRRVSPRRLRLEA